MTMKKTLFLPLLLFIGLFFVSCSKDDMDDNSKNPNVELPGTEPVDSVDLEIKDFVWKAMNNVYLYKSEIPELANNYFSTQADLNNWLETWDTPEDLFYDGLVADQDRFSWIVDDYEELERTFQASEKSAGFKYQFIYAPDSDFKVLASVIFVSPDGPADMAGLKRNDLISAVNGTEINVNNYQTIFNSDNLDLTISTIENGNVVASGDPVTVNKIEFKEKPIAVDKVFTVDGIKIGYIYLSTFLGEFGIDDAKLNDAFAEFKSENIDELVVDLRYNQGGYGAFASDLATMVTGQFEGDIFTKEVWNTEYQDYFLQNDPEFLYTRFSSTLDNGDAINSLNLDKVYIIETDRSYSASEMFLVGLEPYVDVVHVGTNTGGKFMGSYTIYDSETLFTKENINPDHKYALQPLVFKYANADGYTDFVDGLTPDIEIDEDYYNLGQLGDLNEPLLARTIDAITGQTNSSGLISRKSNALKSHKIFMEDDKGYLIGSNKSVETFLKKKVNSVEN